MVKNKIALMLVLVLLASGFSGRVLAEEASPAAGLQQVPNKTYSWQDKIKRGGLNIVSSPVEIARQIQITSNEQDLLHGWTVGFVKGLGQGLLRFGAGVVDVFTCPFDFPKEQKAPLIEPEYVWEKTGVKYS